jgi:hypothetical protein
VQAKAARRSLVDLRLRAKHRRLLRRAFLALFLGLKPKNQGDRAADGYVEV